MLHTLRQRPGWSITAIPPEGGSAIAVLIFCSMLEGMKRVRLDLGKRILLDQPPFDLSPPEIHEIAAELSDIANHFKLTSR